jgi:hypothetical protein
VVIGMESFDGTIRLNQGLDHIVGQLNDKYAKGNLNFILDIDKIKNLINRKALFQFKQLALDCINEMGVDDPEDFRLIVQTKLQAL